MTFWDVCAPFYDLVESINGRAYNAMLKTVRDLIPQESSVLEVAAGTGSISLAASNKAERVLCTDISERMLNISRRKLKHCSNTQFGIRSIYDLKESDSSFDIVIAGHILHLIDEPERAAVELKRVANKSVVLPMSFTKDLHGMMKIGIEIYRLFGFNPKIEFNMEDYAVFLPKIGFDNCEMIKIEGSIPIAVAVWEKNS